MTDKDQFCKDQRMSSEQENLFRERKKYQHSRKHESVTTVRNLNILADNARNHAAEKRKQLQQHFMTILIELCVKMICVEYT